MSEDPIGAVNDALNELEETIVAFRDKMQLAIVGGCLPESFCLLSVVGKVNGEDLDLSVVYHTRGFVPERELATYGDCLLQAAADDINDTGAESA